MAVINPIQSRPGGDGSILIFNYQTLTNGDSGAPIPFAAWADRSVQVFGTWGTGGSLTWEGSNDGGTTWKTLNDSVDNLDITLGADFLVNVHEITELARPRVTAGDGTTDLDCFVLVRRQNSMRT